jgi:transposase
MSDSFWLTEQQFARLEAFLPTDTRGVPRVDDRRVISGIVHVLKSGCRWKDAPVDYGPYKTLYNRFVRWRAKGAYGRKRSLSWRWLAVHRRRSCWIARTSRCIARPLVEKGGVPPSHRREPERTKYQGPCGV